MSVNVQTFSIAQPVATLAVDASIEIQAIIELLQREINAIEGGGIAVMAWLGLLTRATSLNDWISRALTEPEDIDADEMATDVLDPVTRRQAKGGKP